MRDISKLFSDNELEVLRNGLDYYGIQCLRVIEQEKNSENPNLTNYSYAQKSKEQICCLQNKLDILLDRI